MGFYDRDYYRDDPRPGRMGSVRLWTITTWLIVLNIAVFLLDAILARAGVGPVVQRGFYLVRMPPMYFWGNFSVNEALVHLQLWRLITFQFLHLDVAHLLLNMLSLFLFGPIVESYLGARRFVAFYLLCGISGALLFVGLWAWNILGISQHAALIGASGGIFGVLIAAAKVAPDVRVMLIFPPIPMRLRVMAYALMGLAVFNILRSGPNAGGDAAHVGGALLGFALIRRPDLLSLATLNLFRRRAKIRLRRPMDDRP